MSFRRRKEGLEVRYADADVGEEEVIDAYELNDAVRVFITADARYLLKEPRPPRGEEVAKTLKLVEYGLIDIRDLKDPVLRYYVSRELRGLSSIDPLLRDPEVEDVHITGEVVRVVHRRYGVLLTNIRVDPDELMIRLGHRAGLIPTEARPLVTSTMSLGDAMFRVSITRRSDLTPVTSITMRRVDLERYSIPYLIHLDALDPYLAALICTLILLRRSLILAGPPKSGKTTLLRAFLSFIPSYIKIVIIQSSGEVILNPRLFDYETISSRELSPGGKYDYVDLYDNVIRSKSPGFLVIGEIRTDRDFWAFVQASLTRLGTLTTIHAESEEDVIVKMGYPPYGAPKELLLSSIDAILILSYDAENNKKWASLLSLLDYNERFIRVYRARNVNGALFKESIEPQKLLESRAFERGMEGGNPMINMLRDEEGVLEFIHNTAVLLRALSIRYPKITFSNFTELMRNYYSEYGEYSRKLAEIEVDWIPFGRVVYKGLRGSHDKGNT